MDIDFTPLKYLAIVAVVLAFALGFAAGSAFAQVPPVSPACEAQILAGETNLTACTELNPGAPNACTANDPRASCHEVPTMDPAWTAYFNRVLALKARATRFKVKALFGLATPKDRRMARAFYRRYDVSFPTTPYDPVIGRLPRSPA